MDISRLLFRKLCGEIAARASYRLILRRSIDPGALRQWKEKLSIDMSQLVPLVNSLFLSTEYNNLITRSAHEETIMLHYLHHERCRLVRRLPSASLIVDLGGSSPNNPGGALLVMGYAHTFENLLIVDLPLNQSFEQKNSREMFSEVVTQQGRVKYFYMDMASLPDLGLEENSVDLLWMGQSVEHIYEPKFDALLIHIYEILKPGGLFCFDTPNRNITQLQCPACFIHPDHKIEYYFDDLVRKLNRSGFEITETLGVGLADEAVTQGRFLPDYIVNNYQINHRPGESYLMYFGCKKPL